MKGRMWFDIDEFKARGKSRVTSEARRSAHSRVLLSRITLGENETLNWALIKCCSQCTPEILLWIAREGIKLSRATPDDVHMHR